MVKGRRGGVGGCRVRGTWMCCTVIRRHEFPVFLSFILIGGVGWRGRGRGSHDDSVVAVVIVVALQCRRCTVRAILHDMRLLVTLERRSLARSLSLSLSLSLYSLTRFGI